MFYAIITYIVLSAFGEDELSWTSPTGKPSYEICMRDAKLTAILSFEGDRKIKSWRVECEWREDL
jgi:hypothetical protein